MNFIFWNIRKKTDDDFLSHIVNMLNENETDVFMVAELPGKDIEQVEKFINDKTGDNYKHINGHIFEKVVIFAKKDIDIQLKDATHEGKKIAAFTIKSNILDKKIILFVLHFYDKFNCTNEQQNERINRIRRYIEKVEKELNQNDFSIVCGDFNMNPFETPMIKTVGMHAMMDKNIVRKGKRTVEGEDYTFFYNPMWGFWGDCGKGDAPGTYYMDGSGSDIALFWHILDQVLIRKGLIDYLDTDKLNIITEINGMTLLNKKNGKINSKDFSDHLPIAFCLNI